MELVKSKCHINQLRKLFSFNLHHVATSSTKGRKHEKEKPAEYSLKYFPGLYI